MIDGNSDVFGRIVRGKIQDIPYMIWYADYQITNDKIFHLYGRRPWTLWQHSEAGRVAGVVGPVDLDVFYGSFAEFSTFAEGRADPVSRSAEASRKDNYQQVPWRWRNARSAVLRLSASLRVTAAGDPVRQTLITAVTYDCYRRKGVD